LEVFLKKLLLLTFFSFIFVFVCFSENIPYKSLAVKVERNHLISEKSIDSLLGICIKYRIDTLFVPAVYFMEALYDSRILPRSNVLINNKTPSDFDPMEYILKKSATFGILVVPTFDFFTAWPSRDFPINRLHVVNMHPEWLSFDSQGKLLYEPVSLDPGVPEVQNFCISIFREFLINYSPAAVAISEYGYYSAVYGYNPFSMKEFETWSRNNYGKVVTFDDFRVYTLENILKRLISQRDALGFSGRIFLFTLSDPEISKKRHFQDWMNWVNAGLVDFSIFEYWLADLKTIGYDTSKAFDKISGARFLPFISPSGLIPSQFQLIIEELKKLSVSGIVVDTIDGSFLNFLNINNFGVPR